MSLFSLTRRSTSLVHQLLFANQKRFNVRESIHRYVEPHKFKKHMLAATVPYIKRKYQLPEETCKGTSPPEHALHPLAKIYVEELLEDIKKNDFILLIQYNYTKFQAERVYKNTIIKQGGTFHALNNPVYKEVFKILNYDRLIEFFLGRNALVTGQADKLPGCVKSLRKMPQFLLLAGIIDGHIYNVDQLKKISATTNIDQCRAQLVNILDSPAVELSSYLQQHCDTIKTLEADK